MTVASEVALRSGQAIDSPLSAADCPRAALPGGSDAGRRLLSPTVPPLGSVPPAIHALVAAQAVIAGSPPPEYETQPAAAAAASLPSLKAMISEYDGTTSFGNRQ